MKITARIARTLTGHPSPTRELAVITEAVTEGFNEGVEAARRKLASLTDDERAAMYGPCATLDCPSCGGPLTVRIPGPNGVMHDVGSRAPLARAMEVITDRERIRNEMESCEDFGVDSRYI